MLPVFLLLLGSAARADWSFLPESRHHLFQSYSFFIEQHNIVAYRGLNRYWAAVAATLPVAGDNDGPWHPQILFHLSGNDAMHVEDGGGVYTETLDTRIGILGEFEPPFAYGVRFSFGYLHESGHVADGVFYSPLIPLNLGLNVFRLRAVRDFDKMFRVGLTFTPVQHSIPEVVATGMNEFAEYFPFRSNENEKMSPFIAAGIAHRASFSGTLQFHVQAGVTVGNHFDPHHTHDARIVLGYYTGPDPRAKFAEFLGSRSQFGYFGTMFDL